MIELRVSDKLNSLVVDNIVVSTSEKYPAVRDWVSFHLHNNAVVDRICEHSRSDIPSEIKYLWLDWADEKLPFLDGVNLDLKDGKFGIEYEFSFDWENWNNRWSIAQYGEMLLSVGAEMWNQGFTVRQKDSDLVSNGFEVEFLPLSGLSIGDLIAEYTPKVRLLHSTTVARLDGIDLEGELVVRMKIPKAFRGACEQYLIYFGDFLADLGVDSSVNVGHRDQETLLTVIPADKRVALSNIRSALDVYLTLPSCIDTSFPSGSDRLVQELWANIQHLRGQLALRDAVIQAKNVIIQTQGKMALISLPDLIENKPTQKSSSDEEQILGGIVAFKKAETKFGVSISLAEVVRRLKKFFAKPS